MKGVTMGTPIVTVGKLKAVFEQFSQVEGFLVTQKAQSPPKNS